MNTSGHFTIRNIQNEAFMHFTFAAQKDLNYQDSIQKQNYSFPLLYAINAFNDLITIQVVEFSVLKNGFNFIRLSDSFLVRKSLKCYCN